MYQAPTIRKAFQILELLAASGGGLSLSALARSCGISKSTVHGITAALEQAGAVTRDESDKRYHLGPSLLELGRAARVGMKLPDLARGPMEDLMARTALSVFMGTRTGDRVTILAAIEPTRALKITAPTGTRIPLLAGATGKALLSAMTPERAEQLVDAMGLPRFTERSITDPRLYLAELERVRARGYATDDEEYIAGVRAVAAPIKVGHRTAAIWLVGFTREMGSTRMSEIASQTRQTAEAIAAAAWGASADGELRDQ